jgi:hypothetical protein
MKIALIFGAPGKMSADLTEYITGCRAYHICIVCEESGWAYDQHLLFRRFRWEGHYKPELVKLYPCPFEITEEELHEEMLGDIDAICNSDGSLWRRLLRTLYGFRDYAAWALRPFYHAIGKSTPNYGGTVCSGRIRDMGAEHGFHALGTMFEAEPSPCDWARWFAVQDIN